MGNVSENIVNEVKKAICGKDYIIGQTLTSILAGGHILMEDVPGVGKTTLALAFSKTMGLDYVRVQFTPDVLPSDITGFSMYDKRTDSMKYQPGAVFHNLFLADELNRASSRTQSALLEAMEESKVTVDGSTYLLPKPDRFMIRISMGYPSVTAEKAMIESRKNGINPLDDVRTVCDINTLLRMQQEVNNVFVHEKVISYIVLLINKTRGHPDLERGGSPRATLALTSMAKAFAYLSGRNYVAPPDVQKVFIPVISHRLILTPEAEVDGKDAIDIANEIVKSVSLPQI